jgi:broad specificity phosphatase PhoE
VITTFHLVRHGSHDELDRILTGRTPGRRLSKAGEQEVLLLARRLRRQPLGLVLTSPQPRAVKTAELLCAESHLSPPSIDAGLDEIDFGRWAGRSFEELEYDASWRQWNHARDEASTPAGEDMAAVAARVIDVIERLDRRSGGAHIVLVSHGDVIKAAICRFLGLPFQQVHSIDIAPASATTVLVGSRSGSERARHAVLRECLAARSP